jgi:hypothetical protein
MDDYTRGQEVNNVSVDFHSECRKATNGKHVWVPAEWRTTYSEASSVGFRVKKSVLLSVICQYCLDKKEAI